jgi:hypothetical protein
LAGGKKVDMKKLKIENLKSRRKFLTGMAKKAAIPAVVVYSIHKNAPPVFAREPI